MGPFQGFRVDVLWKQKATAIQTGLGIRIHCSEGLASSHDSRVTRGYQNLPREDPETWLRIPATPQILGRITLSRASTHRPPPAGKRIQRVYGTPFPQGKTVGRRKDPGRPGCASTKRPGNAAPPFPHCPEAAYPKKAALGNLSCSQKWLEANSKIRIRKVFLGPQRKKCRQVQIFTAF